MLNLSPKQKPTGQDVTKTRGVHNNLVHFLGPPPPQTSPWLGTSKKTAEPVEKVEARGHKRPFELVKQPVPVDKNGKVGRYKKVLRKKLISGAQVGKRRGSDNVCEYLQEVEDALKGGSKVPRGTLDSPFL